jgi:hypothetical protein
VAPPTTTVKPITTTVAPPTREIITGVTSPSAG